MKNSKVGSGAVLVKRVLVMDDDPRMRRLYSAILTALGYDSETTPDGAKTIQRFKEGDQNTKLRESVLSGFRSLFGLDDELDGLIVRAPLVTAQQWRMELLRVAAELRV